MAKTGGEKKKNKNKSNKKKRTAPNAVAMKQKPGATPRENPFETIWSRKKFDILGKKRKGEERRVGLARSRAIDKRKKTLLVDYERSGKASVFVDKRIGERNEELGEFDKAILRSQRHHQLKFGKKNKFNLSDGEEEDDDFGFLSLGHFPDRDDFEEEVPLEDEGEESGKNSTILKHLDSYGTPNAEEDVAVGGEENIHKTKKEVMEEIMMKSKFFKAQKAKDKEENEQLMEKLDKSFTSLVESQVLLSMTEPSKINALKAIANKAIPKEHLKKDVVVHGSVPVLDQDKPDSYDKLVKEMSLDMRARPSDRAKTPEEIAQEERERLEKLEEERKKRMVAADDSSDEENDNVVKLPTNQPRSVSGDDLGDSFSFDEEPQKKKGWVDEILERRNEQELGDEEDDTSDESESGDDDGEDENSDNDSSDEDSVAREGNLSLKDWEQSDDDDGGTDLEEEDDSVRGDEEDDDDDKKEIEMRGSASSNLNDTFQTQDLDTEHLDTKKIKSKSEKHSAQSDLPFVIEAPKSFDELCALVDNCSNTDVILVINRIRACNAIKLAAENRKKMQVFYGILLQYFAVLANKKPLNFELLNLLVKPLMEMSMEIPYFSAICARQRLGRTRAQFCEAIKNPEGGCWPSFKTLSLLRLWSMIFPCSDFRHAVMTPAILLMCEYLMRCPILVARDVAIGSFLCSMILAVCKQSHKFCPEAITFLRTLLVAATDKKPEYFPESQFCHLVDLKVLSSMVCIQNHVNEISPLNFALVMGMPDDSPFFKSDNFRASLLLTVVETLRGFVETYKGLNSFPEVFLHTTSLLVQVAEQDTMPTILQDKFKVVAQLIKEKVNEHHKLRQPLQMRKQKPVPIKLLNPKFEENFVKGRDYDPDRERVERKKLKKLLKREAKGAARELRKDNYFLLEVKNKERARLEEEKAETYGKARAFLQEQEHAFKSGQLGKGRKRRR